VIQVIITAEGTAVRAGGIKAAIREEVVIQGITMVAVTVVEARAIRAAG